MKTLRYNKGFSLIELMVSLTIFSIVMVIAIGTLLVLIDANAKAQALSSSMTNLSFAIDSMTRNIRTGKDYNCLGTTDTSLNNATLPSDGTLSNCTGSTNNTAIVFTPGFSTTTRMAYRINQTKKSIEQWIDVKNVTDGWVAITSTEQPTAVTVDTLYFEVTGTADSNVESIQPRITLNLAGTVQNGLDSTTPFQIQSTVVQRVLNY